MALKKQIQTALRGIPSFIENINSDYSAKISHTFILHGNIYDYVDNAGNDLNIKKVLCSCYDDNIMEINSKGRKKETQDQPGMVDPGLQSTLIPRSEKKRIIIFYNSALGTEIPNQKSFALWKSTIEQDLSKEEKEMIEVQGDKFFTPIDLGQALTLFNRWFNISKKTKLKNQTAIITSGNQATLVPEIILTLVFTDSDCIFPAGNISQLGGDRFPIVYARNWAQDAEGIGDRTRIILMTRHLSDIHESIRGELAVSHLVRKPNLQDRLEYITNYNENIKVKAAASGGTFSLNGNIFISQINLAPDFTLQEFATQSAGMNRRQIQDVIFNSWRSETPIDFRLVRERKKRALDDEYEGMIDIKEPSFGFDQIGGHEHFKEYCRWEIIKPLKEGNKKLCSRGALMTGPPGTGKSYIAWALAKEAGLNFIQVDLGKVFGGLVGQSLHEDEESYFCDASGRVVERKTMKEAYEQGHLPYTYTYTNNGGFRRGLVADVIRHERAEDFYKIKTRRGREVIVTAGHSVFTRDAKSYPICSQRGPESSGKLIETSAKDLTVGTEIAIVSRTMSPNKPNNKINSKFGTTQVTKELSELGGLWLADGSYNNGKVRISSNLKDTEIISLCETFGPCTKHQPKDSQGLEITINDWATGSKFHELGFSNITNSYTKRIPAWIFGMSDEVVGAFLRGYFSGDGCFSGHSVEATTVCKKLADDIVLLLSRFNIVASIRPREDEKERHIHKGKPFLGAKSYRIHISKASELVIFSEKIGFLQSYKNDALAIYLNTQTDAIKNRGRDKSRYSVFWDKVETIEKLKSEDKYCYDLSVVGTEKFVCSGVLVHNTESNMRKLIEAVEAAAPCIVFVDEIDSVLSSGRTSQGDSGTSARVFNSFMSWLSDPGRVGKVVCLAASNRPDLLDSALIRSGRMDVKIPMLPPAKGDRLGRLEILSALTKKHKIVLSKELLSTKDGNTGLGVLLGDNLRVWTGAEIEQLMQAAYRICARQDRKLENGNQDLTVTISDWETAAENIMPNTKSVEKMTKLALLYTDNLAYVPLAWKEIAKNKELLETELNINSNSF